METPSGDGKQGNENARGCPQSPETGRHFHLNIFWTGITLEYIIVYSFVYFQPFCHLNCLHSHTSGVRCLKHQALPGLLNG